MCYNFNIRRAAFKQVQGTIFSIPSIRLFTPFKAAVSQQRDGRQRNELRNEIKRKDSSVSQSNPKGEE